MVTPKEMFCFIFEQSRDESSSSLEPNKNAMLSEIGQQSEQVSFASSSVVFRCSSMRGNLSVKTGVSDTAVLNISASAFCELQTVLTGCDVTDVTLTHHVLSPHTVPPLHTLTCACVE